MNTISHKMDADLKELFETIEYAERYYHRVIEDCIPDTSRKVLALASYSAVLNYANGIRIMSETKPMSKVTISMVRSMFEAWINLQYMLLGDTDVRILLNTKESITKQITHASRIIKYLERKNLKELSGYNVLTLKKVVEHREQELVIVENELKSRGGSAQTKNLYGKVKEIDRIKIPESLEESVEFNHVTLYGYFSASVHLGHDALTDWIDIQPDGSINFNPNETLESTKRVIWTALALLKDVSVLAHKELNIYDSSYDENLQGVITRLK